MGSLFAVPARAGPLDITSRHERYKLKIKGKAQRFLLLETEQSLSINVSGPTSVGLYLCEILGDKESPLPVDLTVVRDEQEQATVRVRIPHSNLMPITEPKPMMCSEYLQIKIDIPEGRHRYMILASGSRKGVLVFPFIGITATEKVIVATPGGSTSTTPTVSKVIEPKKIIKPGPKRQVKLAAPELDVLEPIGFSSRHSQPQLYSVIRSQPARFGPGTRIAGSIAGMFLLGTTSLVISGSMIHERARDEPFQIAAHELHTRSERTFEASAVMGGLTAAALLATLICYLVEDPQEFTLGSSGNQGLAMHF
jgi:hypothetical protein